MMPTGKNTIEFVNKNNIGSDANDQDNLDLSVLE